MCISLNACSIAQISCSPNFASKKAHTSPGKKQQDTLKQRKAGVSLGTSIRLHSVAAHYDLSTHLNNRKWTDTHVQAVKRTHSDPASAG